METEFDIVVEMEGLDAALIPQDTTYSIIGLDTDTPIMRLGNDFYQGTYEDTIGTSMVFLSPDTTKSNTNNTNTTNNTQPNTTEVYSAEKSLVSMTRKKLKFKKITIKKK